MSHLHVNFRIMLVASLSNCSHNVERSVEGEKDQKLLEHERALSILSEVHACKSPPSGSPHSSISYSLGSS